MPTMTPTGENTLPEAEGLTVAVTGPTGDIGRALIPALEASPSVARIVGMARHPFDPAKRGWHKTRYVQGDVLERRSVNELVRGADVVVHLAFLIFGGRDETREVNLHGSENVFRASVQAGVKRLVYTSSVAAYGFPPDRPTTLTEDMPAAGLREFYYSAHKAELERLLTNVVHGTPTEAYVFRPCIVGGTDAAKVVDDLARIFRVGDRTPPGRLLMRVPGVHPALPDPGTPFQLVHQDDVARALRAAVEGRGTPGVYNLASDDTVRMRDLSRELGWYSLPTPSAVVELAGRAIPRVPGHPPDLDWLQALRVPSIMDTSKARRELEWSPTMSSREILHDTVIAVREHHSVA
jgi:UDP-glucose 4-epimerase